MAGLALQRLERIATRLERAGPDARGSELRALLPRVASGQLAGLASLLEALEAQSAGSPADLPVPAAWLTEFDFLLAGPLSAYKGSSVCLGDGETSKT